MRCVLYKSLIIFNFLAGFMVLHAQTATEIIVAADQFRGYQDQKFQLSIQIISTQPKGTEKSSIQVFADGESSLAKFLSPARSKGQLILSAGSNMWIKLPRGSKVIRISPAQRLLGQVSNGDVASVNFSEDYDAELINQEEIEGELCYKLVLTAKNKSATYKKIEYWVGKKSQRPVQSKHYSLSGKLLKTAFYREFKPFGNKILLSRLLLVDAIKKDHYTWMLYKGYKAEDFPDSFFRKETLSQIRN